MRREGFHALSRTRTRAPRPVSVSSIASPSVNRPPCDGRALGKTFVTNVVFPDAMKDHAPRRPGSQPRRAAPCGIARRRVPQGPVPPEAEPGRGFRAEATLWLGKQSFRGRSAMSFYLGLRPISRKNA